MSNYFDKDFFKFALGFVSIILISLAIILAVRIYETNNVPDAVQNAVSMNIKNSS